MLLIVGLGNPTKKYENTRHNVGFMVIDRLIDRLNPTPINKPLFKGELYKTANTLFLKPQTFMNLSGESVLAVANFYKIDRKDIIVIHDDLDLPLGVVRVKRGGSSGGHNGLKSIDKLIGNDYIRVRVGIGRPSLKDEVVKYVLSDFTKHERECLDKSIKRAMEIVLDLMENDDLSYIKNRYPLKKSVCE
ncbi:MAG: aminoacyl-tRNA hydrolase [Epsilonproteobacteria bacterium]|nr:aminoacyl-tRNA hydrolase [Campylobacterota bacterium]